MSKAGRNDPCPCGSGKKYKQCCLSGQQAMSKPLPVAAPTLQLVIDHFNASRWQQAETVCLQLLRQQPKNAKAHHMLGLIAFQTGKHEQAIDAIQTALRLDPHFAEAHSNLASVFNRLGRLAEAENHYLQSLAIEPMAVVHYNLGIVLDNLGKTSEAMKHYQRALHLDPSSAATHLNLGNLLQSQNRLDEAVAHYRQATQLDPTSASAHNNLGNVLMDQGNDVEADQQYRQALALQPDYQQAYSNLLFLQSYGTVQRPQHDLTLARGWEKACIPASELLAANKKILKNTILAGRRLKIGYVSGDFRRHAVSYFIEQIFTHYDRSRFELFAYYTHGLVDPVTERLQELVDHWCLMTGMSDNAAVQKIQADGIDVLIDLSGHTAHNRLGVFARRAAPVQAHYLGYFASTGLSNMDYWIGDDWIAPESMDDQFSETVWRLPRTWVAYKTIAEAPPVQWQPANDGTIWLGCFNSLNKITPETLALWAKILIALPKAKLRLKANQLGEATTRTLLLETLAHQEITADRVDLLANSDWVDYMAEYNRLDIALDPVGGHGGGTTTCDALWMGVPVIHLAGNRTTSRFAASMLNAIGHPEWIAVSEEDYLEKTITLARNVDLRKQLRPLQRNLMANSPLCDAQGLTKSLEDAYVEMFERTLRQ